MATTGCVRYGETREIVVASQPCTALALRPETFTPAIYDAMLEAIAECHRVDEVKDVRDKAEAIRIYAKQAGNFKAELQAMEIRLRAEHRVGELLKEAVAAGKLGAG